VHVFGDLTEIADCKHREYHPSFQHPSAAAALGTQHAFKWNTSAICVAILTRTRIESTNNEVQNKNCLRHICKLN